MRYSATILSAMLARCRPGLALLALAALPLASQAQTALGTLTTSQTLNPGTYTFSIPAGQYAKFEGWGGGGAGGNGIPNVGGGGGGGAYATLLVTGPATYSATVGVKGTYSPVVAATLTQVKNSSSATVLQAAPGGRGQNGNNAGGTGGQATASIPSTTAQSGANGSTSGGNGGGPGGGKGGNGGGGATAGAAPGGGGGGGNGGGSAAPGLDGGNGQLRITLATIITPTATPATLMAGFYQFSLTTGQSAQLQGWGGGGAGGGQNSSGGGGGGAYARTTVTGPATFTATVETGGVYNSSVSASPTQVSSPSTIVLQAAAGSSPTYSFPPVGGTGGLASASIPQSTAQSGADGGPGGGSGGPFSSGPGGNGGNGGNSGGNGGSGGATAYSNGSAGNAPGGGGGGGGGDLFSGFGAGGNGGNGQLIINLVVTAPTLTAINPTSGSVGSTVTLTGTNLTGATQVTFGGTANNTVATGFTVNAAGTSITDVVVPTGAATGNVTVTTPGGTSNGVAFTITVPQLAVSQGSTAYSSGGAAYAFAAQNLTTTSAPISFTLTNGGTAALTITGIVASGDFAISGTVPTTVAAGGTATVAVTFAPTATGARTGSFVISSSLGTYTVNLTGTGQNPTITTSALSASAYCAGSALTVPFTATAGFAAGNVFTAQLSDASGSFAAPVAIGTLTGTTSGSIAATLPAGTTGTGYRVRVVGSTPAITGTDNGTNLTLTAPPVATFGYGAATSFCTTQTTAQAVMLATGATAGTFTVAPATGLTLAANGSFTPSASTAGTYTVTNTVAASGGCAAVTSTSTVTITAPPVAAFDYGAATSFCTTQATAQPVVLTAGSTAGTFSAGTGLVLNSSTGAITPSSSTPGTYTVTNTVAASGGCAAVTATSTVTITAPATAGFDYGAATSFCTTQATAQAVVLAAGSTAGTFSAGAGLTLAANGSITPSTSTAGTYTVTNTVAASGGCAAVTSTSTVTITAPPVAAFDYGAATSFCTTQATAQAVVLATGATAGAFTVAPATGLTLAANGAITPSSSTPGTYTVTNTVAASGGCAAVTSTSTITITAPPVAAFDYGVATSFCTTQAAAQPVVLAAGSMAGTFSAGTGLVLNASTGAITPSTSTPGTYTVTNTVAANGGCAAVTATSTVTITAPATAGFSFAATPVCAGTAATLTPALAAGATAGTFSLPTATGLSLAPATGEVTVGATAAAGSYTVTNTVAAAGGCAAVVSTATFKLTPQTTAGFSYTGSPFCQSAAAAITPAVTGTTGGTFSAPAGLTIDALTGSITPGSSTAGTYVVTYAVAGPCGSSSTQSVTITGPGTAGFSYPTPAAGTACAGSTTTFAATLATGATAGTFSVSPQGLGVNPTTGALALAGAAAGTYTVTNTLAAAGGCAAVTSTATFVVNSLPATPVLSVSGTPATGLTLTSSAATGNQFYRNGVLMPGATGQTLLVNSGTNNGSYTVVATSGAGCASAVSLPVSIVVTATAAATTLATQVRLYPNPAREQATLVLPGVAGTSTVRVDVLNVLGQVVLHLAAPLPAGGTTLTLPTAGLATGTYLVRLSAGELQTIQRLSVE